MIFLADESVDRQIIERLRQDGHQVLDVTELDPGISDDKVLSMANESDAILLTSDRDFGDLVFRQRKTGQRYCSHPVGGFVFHKKSCVDLIDA
jgi:predicted nuclease of predicted toxin-antitoxin system